MMKLKVLKQFHDKETDQIHNAGNVIEVSDKRGKEILASKYNVAELLEVGEPDTPQSGAEGEPEGTEPTEVQLEQNPEGTEAGAEPAKQAKKSKSKNKK